MDSATAMDADASSKEGRSHRNRVMEHAIKSLGEKFKAASADGDGVRARQLLSQLQVRAIKRTRSIKRSSSCKKLASLGEGSAGSTQRRPATPPPQLRLEPRDGDAWRQGEILFGDQFSPCSSEGSATPTPSEDLRVDIVELGEKAVATEGEMNRGDDIIKGRRRLAMEEFVSFFLKRNFFLFFFFFFCFSVFLVSK